MTPDPVFTMNRRTPIDFEPRDIGAFLKKIEHDRDQELAQIDLRRKSEVRRILGNAYKESHRIHKQAAQQLRARRRLERDRYLAGVRADLRRRRWKVLTRVQQRAADVVWRRLLRAWLDPDRQWTWCRMWLDAALQLAEPEQPLEICLGRGIRREVQTQIETTVSAYGRRWRLALDRELGPGLVIRWQDSMLDGRLRSQCPDVAETLLQRIARVLHNPNHDEPA